MVVWGDRVMKQLYICEKCGGNGYLQLKGSGVGGFRRCPVCGGRGEVEERPNPVAKIEKPVEPVVEEAPVKEKPAKKTRKKKTEVAADVETAE